MRLAIISFTVQGGRTAERLERGFKDLGHQSRAFSVQKLKIPLSKFVETAFRDEEGLVFVGAAGIAVRSIAPCLKGKDRDPAVIVVDELNVPEIKTKTMQSFLTAVNAGKAVLVTPEVNMNVVKSARNIPGVSATTAKLINVYDILNAKQLIVDKAALAVIEEVFA